MLISKVRSTKITIICLLSIIISLTGIFLFPPIYSAGTGQYEDILLPVLIFIADIIIILCLIAFLRFFHQKQSGKKERYLISFGRVILLAALFVLFFIMASLICGLISVLTYSILKNILLFGQIKGIIDYIVSLITLLILPFVISIFWSEINSEDRFLKAFASGVHMKGRRYLKLLVLLLVIFGMGMVITVICNYWPDKLILNIIKALFIGVPGIIGLFVSDKICRQRGIKA